jgi:hypothetical protein
VGTESQGVAVPGFFDFLHGQGGVAPSGTVIAMREPHRIGHLFDWATAGVLGWLSAECGKRQDGELALA